MRNLYKCFIAVMLITSTACFSSDEVSREIESLKVTGRAFSAVAKKAIPAVVAITGERDVRAREPRVLSFDGIKGWYFGGRGDSDVRSVEQGGTGFLVSSNGYILTNHHVIRGADRIKVKLHDGRIVNAALVGADPRSEVALLKVDGDGYQFLELGDSSQLEIGEWVIAIGNQFGFFSESLTVGVVSAKGRSNLALAEYEDFIQTDAAINPGNSGGPLLNIEGKAVGINTAIFSQSGGYMGIGLAVPINMAKAVKDQLIANNGKVVRGYLGVRFNPGDVYDKPEGAPGGRRSEGAGVEEVLHGTPAESAGLKAGDVIVELNGRTIDGPRALMRSIALMGPGSSVEMRVRRQGEQISMNVTLGVFPGDDFNPEKAAELAAGIGLGVAELTSQLAWRYGYSHDKGVIISSVEDGSLAQRAELAPGLIVLTVNGISVDSVGEFNMALGDSLQTKRVVMRVRSREYSWYVLIPLD